MPLTDLSFLQTGAQWPPPDEKPRLERYAKNRQLWKGEHDAVWGNWWRVLREDQAASMELIFNWHKRLSTLWADLLLSEPPRFFDGTEEKDKAVGEDGKRPINPRQEHVDRLSGKDDNSYVSCLYEIALDISRYGDGLAKVTLEEEGSQIWAQPPHYWFPVVHPGNLRLFTHHVLAWQFKQNDEDYLWAEIHEKGRVTRTVFHIKGNLLGEEASVLAFDPNAHEYDLTKINDFLVIPFHGLLASDEIFGDDDYHNLDSVIAALEVRAGQINIVLDKHTDPTMYGPPGQIEEDEHGNSVFKAGGRYIEVDEDDQGPPGYVTWEGQLESQFNELEFLLQQLYALSDTSPAAFGKLESGLAESGSALRRLMQAPLAKVARMKMHFDPCAKRALKIAADLETNNGRGTPAIEKFHIQWQDGLPNDPLEQAQTEQARITSETTSHVSAIRRLDGGTLDEAQDEYDRIQEEAQAKAESDIENQAKAAALTEGQEGKPPGSTGSRQSQASKSKDKK